MKELINIGISIDTIKNMLDVNPNLNMLDKNDINDKIYILKNIGCNNAIIKNIIETNPLFLSKSNQDILNLIEKLNSLNIK